MGVKREQAISKETARIVVELMRNEWRALPVWRRVWRALRGRIV
jgi:hypothetical protein